MECVPVPGWNMKVKPGGLADIITEAVKKYHKRGWKFDKLKGLDLFREQSAFV